MDQESETLRQAEELVRSGRSQEALPRLLALVKANPRSEQAWLLLSYTLTDSKQQRDCLQRVININPANTEAAARLTKLANSGAAAQRPQPPLTASGDIEPQTRLTKLAGKTGPLPRLAPQRPALVKASPFTGIDEDDLLSAAAAELPIVSSAQASPPAPENIPATPASPTDWLARLNSDASPPQSATGTASGPQLASQQADKQTATQAQIQSPRSQATKSRRLRPVEIAIIGLLIVSTLGCGIAAFYAFQTFQAQQDITEIAAPPTPSPVPSRTFTPDWTPTVEESSLTPPTSPPVPLASPATATPAATRTPTQPPTPNSTMRAAMDTIQQQVADVRGLAIQGDVPRYLISKYRLEITARGLLVSQDYQAKLKNMALVYSALGLIKPNYDLAKYALNSQVDSIGGFYLPWTKQLFVVGDKFSGLEHYIFAHEYDHALVDQHFGISNLGLYPECEGDAQRCRAIRALIEGDATLLMNLWWQQYANPQDYDDIKNYQPPQQAVAEQNPPPFALRDGDLSHKFGDAFVKFLHDRGNWAEVNKAYTNLPQSTEQIMHPEKYLSREAPIAVSAPPLTETLGGDWRQIDDNSLGEWMTYLVLGYGADVAAQTDDATAAKAAAGWGGDHYQIFYNEALTQTVLAAQWIWDKPSDLKEFTTAIQFYLNERFRGAKINDRTDGDCWETNNQATCLFVKNQATLWLLAPNQSTLNLVLAQYPDFR